MADNSRPSDDSLYADDEVGGVRYIRVKQAWGPDGTANDVSNATPLPVADAKSNSVNNIGHTTSATPNTVTQVVPDRPTRKEILLQNFSDAPVWLLFGASGGDFFVGYCLVPNGGEYKSTIYTGVIRSKSSIANIKINGVEVV